MQLQLLLLLLLLLALITLLLLPLPLSAAVAATLISFSSLICVAVLTFQRSHASAFAQYFDACSHHLQVVLQDTADLMAGK